MRLALALTAMLVGATAATPMAIDRADSAHGAALAPRDGYGDAPPPAPTRKCRPRKPTPTPTPKSDVPAYATTKSAKPTTTIAKAATTMKYKTTAATAAKAYKTTAASTAKAYKTTAAASTVKAYKTTTASAAKTTHAKTTAKAYHATSTAKAAAKTTAPATPTGHPTDCAAAREHFRQTGSPTLMQCIEIACAPGQTSEYRTIAVDRCYILEDEARRNNGGKLPYGW
ncbi:hypothetical protein HK105_200533 [Polyrhizophydium stewartii]|uniref:Uncharacterized protein n=1 Tax=Polyrhizophydium stewartii TaxID=2732419 RepID=A0ABR4NJH8_9FUNG